MTKTELTRETILDGAIADFARRNPGRSRVLSDHERQASLDDILSRAPSVGDIWVFGYGSLIWNPAFHFEERCIGQIYGYHRRFCLWTQLGRGCPKQPGLVLGLDRGGSCHGVAYRIAAPKVQTELDILWRREMLSGAYVPVWITAHTAAGPVPALSFAIDRKQDRYSGRLPEETIVRSIAFATGELGACSDYLYATVQNLSELGIKDRYLERLAECVKGAQLARQV